jgi:hypothetical protein
VVLFDLTFPPEISEGGKLEENQKDVVYYREHCQKGTAYGAVTEKKEGHGKDGQPQDLHGQKVDEDSPPCLRTALQKIVIIEGTQKQGPGDKYYSQIGEIVGKGIEGLQSQKNELIPEYIGKAVGEDGNHKVHHNKNIPDKVTTFSIHSYPTSSTIINLTECNPSSTIGR